jgi:hypothetical protein
MKLIFRLTKGRFDYGYTMDSPRHNDIEFGDLPRWWSKEEMSYVRKIAANKGRAILYMNYELKDIPAEFAHAVALLAKLVLKYNIDIEVK